MGIINTTYSGCWSRAVINQGRKEIKGVKTEIFGIISKIANFTPRYVIDVNGEITDTDVYFHPFNLRSLEKSNIHMTSSFIEVREVIISTPGELFTSYEKLWFPFDNPTWKCLIFTFLIIFTAIFIIYRLPKSIQIRLFGENIKTPSLNVFSTFFGISQFKLPKSHIPRFILIIFVFFCLIIRTCYQSKLFEFLTSEPRRIPPQTLEELLNKNFKLHWTQNADLFYELFKSDDTKWYVHDLVSTILNFNFKSAILNLPF